MKDKIMRVLRGEVPLYAIFDRLGVNRILSLFGFVLADKNCGYYNYYWYNAYKKIDLKKVPIFSEVASEVAAHKTSYLSYDRLYTLWQLVDSVGEGCVAEVGTYRGGSAWFIAESMRRAGKKNRFFVFDTFEGHAVVDESVDGDHSIHEGFRNVSFEKVRDYLSVFPNVKVTKGNFLETSAVLESEGPFSLAHVDVDVYPATKYCLEFFGSRLVAGGAMVVDDYGFTTCMGAKKAVDEFVAASSGFRMIHLLTGQAVLIKLGSGEK